MRIDWRKLLKERDDLLDLEVSFGKFEGATWRQLIESPEEKHQDFVSWASYESSVLSERLKQVLDEELMATGYYERLVERHQGSDRFDFISEWD